MTDTADQATCILEERVPISNHTRRLEGTLAYRETSTPEFAVLIAGPHPFLGGDARNNLVRFLAVDLAKRNALTLRFDYAGIGESEGGPNDWPAALSDFWKNGTFAGEQDWIEDTAAAMRVLKRLLDRPLIAIGYSFGGWAISRCLSAADVHALVLISPNPKRHDFAGLSASRAPLLVVASDNDFTCSAAEVREWVDRVRDPKSYALIEAGEHFFRGREPVVLQTVTRFLGDIGVAVG